VSAETASLIAVARLFSELLLFELDAAQAAKLRALAPALAELGVRAPADEHLEELAADFYARFVQPERGGPPVQSLWTTGAYEGEPAARVRALAAQAGLEHDRGRARGAAPDHVGSILGLWAETRERAPAVAEELERHHLRWALAPLAHAGRGEGFYAGVARAAARFVEQLAGIRVTGPSSTRARSTG
jgi:TorA maturation chaperone TorD